MDRPVQLREHSAVGCTHSILFLRDLCPDEVDLFNSLSRAKTLNISEISRESLLAVSRKQGPDLAAALFYKTVVEVPRNALFLRELDSLEQKIDKNWPALDSEKILFAFVPGMFYAKNQELGTDGAGLRRIAEKLGMQTALIPIDPTGSVEFNGRIICSFIEEASLFHNPRAIILGSLSKGGADVRMAIDRCGSSESFKLVRAWVNINGINRGTPFVDLVRDDTFHWLEARSYFCIHGFHWEGLTSMEQQPGLGLDKTVKMPEHLKIVSVVSVPISRYVTDRARPYYDALNRYSPNDGLILLADNYLEEGLTFPVWRNDHYFINRLSDARVAAIFTFTARNLVNAP